jgi:hypothetical protein
MREELFAQHIFQLIPDTRHKLGSELKDEFKLALKTANFKKYWMILRFFKACAGHEIDLKEYTAGPIFNSESRRPGYLSSSLERFGRAIFDNREYFYIKGELHGYDQIDKKYYLNGIPNRIKSLRYL